MKKAEEDIQNDCICIEYVWKKKRKDMYICLLFIFSKEADNKITN